MGGKSSPGPAPDYRGAANETAAGNLEAARTATKANRVDQNTPYGNLTWSHTGDDQDAGWSQSINLSPVGQQLLDYSNNASIGLGQQTGQALGRVNSSLAQPFDANSGKAATDQAYANITSRLNPQFDRQQTSLETQLTNQGIGRGSEAWGNAMKDFNYGKNDAFTQANTAAMNYAPQILQMDLAARNQPLNELNALRTGSQVNNPQFGAVPQQQTTAGPNMLGAAGQQGQYDTGLFNLNQQQGANTMNGVVGLVGAAAAAY